MPSFLSDSDQQILQEIIDDYRQSGRRPNRASREKTGMTAEGGHMAPETYVGKPQSTIPALTTSPDTPGSALCDVYRVDDATGVLETVSNLTKTVYNLSTSIVTSNYIPITRTKSGKWLTTGDPTDMSSPSDDIYFRISSADTGGATNYWTDKVTDLGGGTYDSSEDLGVDYQVNNPSGDEDVTLFVDVSAINSYTASAFEVIAVGADNTTRMYNPKNINTITAAEDFEMAIDAASVVGEMNIHLDSSSIANYTSGGNELLGHNGATKRWFNFADEFTFDGGEDFKVSADFVTTTGEIQLAVDSDSLLDYSETLMQFLGHTGSGTPSWFEMQNSQTAWEASEDFQISWFIDAGTNRIRFFIEGDALHGWLPAGEPRLFGPSANDTGTAAWNLYHFDQWESGSVFNASNHIPIRIETQDGADTGGPHEDLQTYFTPTQVPGTDPSSGETTAISIANPSTAFSQTLIDSALGGIDISTGQNINSGTAIVLNLLSSAGPTEHTNPDGVNEELVLQRNGTWYLHADVDVEPTTGSGTTVNGTITIEIYNDTGSAILNSEVADCFSLGDTSVRVIIGVTATISITANTAIKLRAHRTGSDCTVNGGTLFAIWQGIAD